MTPAKWPDRSDSHPYTTKYTAQRVALTDGPELKAAFTTDRYRFGADEDMLGFHISGFCPGCNHFTTGLCATKFVTTESSSGELDKFGMFAKARPSAALLADAIEPTNPGNLPTPPPPPPTQQTRTIQTCACIRGHADQPAGVHGCGAQWMLNAEYGTASGASNTELTAVAEHTAAREWAGAVATYAAIPTSLATEQAAAGKWQTALGALVPLLGVGVIISGASAVQAMAGWERALVGLAFALAIICDIGMLWEGDVASIGFMKLVKAPKPGEVGLSSFKDADLLPLEMAARSIKKLNKSFQWMKWTVFFSAVTIGLYVFVPPHKAAPALDYKVTEYVAPVNGTPAATAQTVVVGCGEIASNAAKAGAKSVTGDPALLASNGGTLKLLDGTKVKIAAGQVKTAEPC